VYDVIINSVICVQNGYLYVLSIMLTDWEWTIFGSKTDARIGILWFSQNYAVVRFEHGFYSLDSLHLDTNPFGISPKVV